jgi:muconolactone delta-isomerase
MSIIEEYGDVVEYALNIVLRDVRAGVTIEFPSAMHDRVIAALAAVQAERSQLMAAQGDAVSAIRDSLLIRRQWYKDFGWFQSPEEVSRETARIDNALAWMNNKFADQEEGFSP